MLFLTSYFTGSEVILVVRRRPTSTHPRARAAKAFFGDKGEKEVQIPSVAVAYNNHMNAVDCGDQLRSYHGFNHSIRRGPWQALAWTFLLDTVLINTYILQHKGQSDQKSRDNQVRWREQLCNGLIAKYHSDGSSRMRFRTGDEFTPYSQHKHVKRTQYSPCKACQGRQLGTAHTRSSIRPALAPRDSNNQVPKKRATQTNYGCDKCKVAICTKPDCWYFYHLPIC